MTARSRSRADLDARSSGSASSLYVLLDGFDLGVGMLYGFAPDTRLAQPGHELDRADLGRQRDLAGARRPRRCWRRFPLAFAIIIPAVYFPILIMLLALVFRGVAFEFRFRDAEHRTFWDHAFCYGSALATFAQGVVLGAFIQGFEVDGPRTSPAARSTASRRSRC